MSRFYDLMTGSVRALAADVVSFPADGSGRTPAPQAVKLDANESPYGPSPRAVAGMLAVLEESHQYPDDHAAELRQRLAEKHSVESEQILVAPGSSGLLCVIARTMLESGLRAITSEKSFLFYRHAARAAGGDLIEVPAREDGYDLDAMLAAIDEQTRLIFVANPNNPTGTFLGAQEIDRFLARVPSHVVVVLDEAYHDYAEHFAGLRRVEHPHSMDYVREARNVVVLRTFSKAHGLAGVRVGYGIGPVELMGYFANMQEMFAVSSLAQAAALGALEDETHVRNAVEKNAQQAEWLTSEISRLGFRVLPTWANFLFCDLGADADAMAGRLLEEGISVRPLTAWGAPSAIRITIGTAEQNQAVLSALQKTASRATHR
jgi:histidinol-phosphate aminotransferase